MILTYLLCVYICHDLKCVYWQEWRGDDVLDLSDKPGSGALLCSSLPCCHRLHEEILSTNPAVLVHSTQTGTHTHTHARALWFKCWLYAISVSQWNCWNWAIEAAAHMTYLGAQKNILLQFGFSTYSICGHFELIGCLNFLGGGSSLFSPSLCARFRKSSCWVTRTSWSRWAWSWRSTGKTRPQMTPKAANGRSSDSKSTTSHMRCWFLLKFPFYYKIFDHFYVSSYAA